PTGISHRELALCRTMGKTIAAQWGKTIALYLNTAGLYGMSHPGHDLTRSLALLFIVAGGIFCRAAPGMSKPPRLPVNVESRNDDDEFGNRSAIDRPLPSRRRGGLEPAF
ncbi:MAG: hypothetical protein ABSF38_15320, partial [Verrucomicrobiota bacterium]